MIPIQESRVENKVDLYGTIATIQRTDFDINGVGIAIDEGKPIPLTEEWLIKFGLPRRWIISSPPYYQYSIRNDFEIYCYMDTSGNCLFWGKSSLENSFFIIKCDTVHVFQNTYAVLNPHEKLTIKQ